MINFCITSNIHFYEKTYEKIIRSLLESGIPPEQIYFFIGGHDITEQIHNKEGINLYKVNHNSIDLTALISVVELNIESKYWFLLHDTCLVGNNFYNLISNFEYDNIHSVALTYDISMNIGCYHWDFLQQNKDILLRFKNIDYSAEGIQRAKQLAVQHEDCLLNINKLKYYCQSPRQIHHSNDIYNTGVNRIIESFSEIDLFKIKANWETKHTYEVRL